MAAAPISVVLGSPISGALLELHGVFGLSGWQWMFLLEAVPAFLLGFVVLGYMTERPEKATWLKDDEREWLVNVMNAERAAKAATAAHSIWRGLADLRVLALSLIYFGTSAGLYTLARIMRDGEGLTDGCGKKRAIRVANRCSNELRFGSALRHSRHERR